MRVAGGTLRGRRLLGPAARDTRPTSERARAGLFDWLGERVAGRDVLDLYAGTGALGIEALSRGARSAVFVERAARNVAALRRNCRELGLEAATQVMAARVAAALAGLARAGRRFGLVLADPPYAGDEAARLAKDSNLLDILAPDALLVLERRAGAPAPDGGPALVLREERRYGDTAFGWYDRALDREGPPE